jgi:hypothetical protein
LYFYEFDEDFKLLSKQVHEIPNYYYCMGGGEGEGRRGGGREYSFLPGHDFVITDKYYTTHHTPFYSLVREKRRIKRIGEVGGERRGRGKKKGREGKGLISHQAMTS